MDNRAGFVDQDKGEVDNGLFCTPIANAGTETLVVVRGRISRRLFGSGFSENPARHWHTQPGGSAERPSSVTVSHHFTSLSKQVHLLPVAPAPVDPGPDMAHQPDSELQPDSHRSDSNLPLTPDRPIFNEPLLPPAAPYLAPSEGTSTPRDSYITNNSAANSAPLLAGVSEKDPADSGMFPAKKQKPFHKRPLIWALGAISLALIVAAVVVPVYFTVIKPKNNTVTGGTGGSDNDDPNTTPTHDPPTSTNSGGDGSLITAEDGTEFTYSNPYGGICESTPSFLLRYF